MITGDVNVYVFITCNTWGCDYIGLNCITLYLDQIVSHYTCSCDYRELYYITCNTQGCVLRETFTVLHVNTRGCVNRELYYIFFTCNIWSSDYRGFYWYLLPVILEVATTVNLTVFITCNTWGCVYGELDCIYYM